MAQVPKEGAFINCKISIDIVRQLEIYMKKSRLSKTAIVEMALEDYFKKVMPEEEMKHKK